MIATALPGGAVLLRGELEGVRLRSLRFGLLCLWLSGASVLACSGFLGRGGEVARLCGALGLCFAIVRAFGRRRYSGKAWLPRW